MSIILKSIFEGIEIKEKTAGKLYKELALKTKNSDIKEALLKMSKDELGHEEFFDSSSLEHIKEINKHDFEDITKKLTEKVEFDMSNVVSVLEKAIAEENFAEKAYLVLSSHLSKELSDCLIEISKQEALHKEILVKLKEEFDSSDWN